MNVGITSFKGLVYERATSAKELINERLTPMNVGAFAYVVPLASGCSCIVQYATQFIFSGMALKMNAPVAFASATFYGVKRGVQRCFGSKAFNDISGNECAYPVLYSILDGLNQATYAVLFYSLFSEINAIKWVGLPLCNLTYNIVSEGASEIVRRNLFDSFKSGWQLPTVVIFTTASLSLIIKYTVILQAKPGDVANTSFEWVEKHQAVTYLPTILATAYKLVNKVRQPTRAAVVAAQTHEWEGLPEDPNHPVYDGEDNAPVVSFVDPQDAKKYEVKLVVHANDAEPSSDLLHAAPLPDFHPKNNDPHKGSSSETKHADGPHAAQLLL